MSFESFPREPIELPGLVSLRLNLISADLHIATDSHDLANPQLTLEGDDEAFKYSYRDGRFTLNENSGSSHNITFIPAGGSRSLFKGGGDFSNVVLPGGAIRINGKEIISPSPGITMSTRRRALLFLPTSYAASHDINSMNGGVELDSLSAKSLSITSLAGSIAVLNSTIDSIIIKTVSGNVKIAGTKSRADVFANTMSGNIEISDSDAPAWRLNTELGSIATANTIGKIDTNSAIGRTQVSD